MAWVLGTLLCALGIVICTKANLGLSMFAAQAYILHIRLHDILPWLTQGTAQYLYDGAMLTVMCLIVGRLRRKYFLSFLYGVFLGMAIDMWVWVLGGNGAYVTWTGRVLGYIAGTLSVTLAIAFMFRTYLPPQVPELMVLEVAKRFGLQQTKVKQIVDFGYLAICIAMALLLTGKLTGIGIGTVVAALINAPLIRLWSKLLDRWFTFDPLLPKLEKILQ